LNWITPATATRLRQVDFSGVWETTTNASQAMLRNNLIIAPTQCPGYWTFPTIDYLPAENKTYPWRTTALTNDSSEITIPFNFVRQN